MRFLYAVTILACCLGSCARPDGAASLHDIASKQIPSIEFKEGLFPADSLLKFNRQRLTEVFGVENIVDKEHAVAFNRKTDHVILLFPSTEKQVEMIVSDSTAAAEVLVVTLRKNSIWSTRSGLTAGMRLKELERLNTKPFLFLGGGWDQGGSITNWNNGTLDGKIISCRLDPNFIMPYDLSKGDYDSHHFSSDSKDAQAGNPVVEEIIIADVGHQ